MTRLITNILALSIFLYAWVIYVFFNDFYIQSVQEDEYLEWATFFGFILATVLFALAGYDRQKIKEQAFPWFLYGLAFFCFIFAMEEISWAQRILAYRPPVYFLAENFQQEFNFHNVVDTSLRKLMIQTIQVGFGVLLPLAMLPSVGKSLVKLISSEGALDLRALAVITVPYLAVSAAVSTWLWLGTVSGLGQVLIVISLFIAIPFAQILGPRLGFVSPSIWYAPAFTVIFIFAVWYPWKYTGELTELAMAVAFTLVALDENWKNGIRLQNIGKRSQNADATPWVQLVGAVGLILVVGVGSAVLSRIARSADEDLMIMAETEVIAITRDYIRLYQNNQDKFVISCRLHKRVYTYVEAYGTSDLKGGEFVGLQSQGLPAERAEFFIDPWNAPYWIRLTCDYAPGTEKIKSIHVQVYSFGPNRRRESTDDGFRDDDIGKRFTIEF